MDACMCVYTDTLTRRHIHAIRKTNIETEGGATANKTQRIDLNR